MREIRLFFEPKKGTCVNHSKMFKHYVENYLADFEGEYGGSISMKIRDKVLGAFEPVYQYIIREPTHTCINYLQEYIRRNPIEGYYVHLYIKEPNENSEYQGVI